MPILIAQQQDLVTIKVLEPINDHDFNSYIQQFNSLLTPENHFYLMIDLTELNDIPYKFIMNQGLYMKKMHHQVRRSIGASTIVISKPTILNLIDTLFAIKKPVAPNLITQDYQEALSYLTQYKKEYYLNNSYNNLSISTIE